MKLTTYLQNKKISEAAFGRMMEHDHEGQSFGAVSHTTVGRWCNNEAMPRKQYLRRIKEVTGGKVTANDFAAI